ncbi:MAG: hypothetical protein AAF702_14610 [Chloroflexota bacterium]
MGNGGFRHNRRILLLFLLSLTAACSSQASPVAQDDPEPRATRTNLPATSRPSIATALPSPAPTSPSSGVIEPSRIVSSELHATDPAAFQLASGRLQFIELFAFW